MPAQSGYGPWELSADRANVIRKMLEANGVPTSQFFMVAGLRAEEREEFKVDRRERGSFQHEILMEFHRRLQDQGKRWRDVTPAANGGISYAQRRFVQRRLELDAGGVAATVKREDRF